MKRAIFALALVFVAATPAAPPPSAAVMATVHQFIDGFNTGNTKSALAACASPVSILDDFPPHLWYGPKACLDWANAYTADANARGITDGIVTLLTPRRVDVAGDSGYAVVPATYAYRLHGKPVTESGNVLTVALHKTAAGWRITGWAWSRH
jgi:hypothetical protein